MTTVLYSPGDSRGWGIGNSSMRGDYYLIGGALQPSDVYTVRVREHWRRKRGARPAAAVIVPSVPAPRGRSRKRAIAIPGRVLRSRTLPALPAPSTALVPAGPVVPVNPPVVAVTGAKRRRLG